MFAFRVSLAFVLCSLAGQVSADISECRQIEDSLARLTCYDAISIVEPFPELTVESAFAKYLTLVQYVPQCGPDCFERGRWVGGEWLTADDMAYFKHDYQHMKGGYSSFMLPNFELGLIRETAVLDDCQMVIFQNWTVHLAGSERSADGHPIFDKRVYPTRQPSQMYVTFFDLRHVSLPDSGSGTIQMERGHEIYGDVYHGNLDLNLQWEQIISESKWWDGEHKGGERTMSKTLGWAYPEDSAEIATAFSNLVSACQG